MIGQQLSNAFVNNVAARNKSKLRHGGRVRYLRYKSDSGSIQFT